MSKSDILIQELNKELADTKIERDSWRNSQAHTAKLWSEAETYWGDKFKKLEAESKKIINAQADKLEKEIHRIVAAAELEMERVRTDTVKACFDRLLDKIA